MRKLLQYALPQSGAWVGAVRPDMARRGAAWQGDRKGRVVGALFLVPLMAGCVGMGSGNMGGMTAAEINAAIKDKSSSAVCTEFIGTGGKFTALYTNTDKSTLQSGGGRTTVECGAAKVVFEDAGRAPAVPKEPAAPPK